MAELIADSRALSVRFRSDTSRTIAVANVPAFVFHEAKRGSAGNSVPFFLRYSTNDGGTQVSRVPRAVSLHTRWLERADERRPVRAIERDGAVELTN